MQTTLSGKVEVSPKSSRLSCGLIVMDRIATWSCGLLLPLLFMLGLSTAALAQNSGRVDGIVHDPSGAVIPGASVVLRNEASGTDYKGQTDASGYYSIDILPPATYTIRVNAPGFQPSAQSGLVVHPSDRLSVPVTLQIGKEVQTVEVQAAPVAVVTTDSGSEIPVIGASQIENLATEGRNAMELLTLLPGVVNSGFDPSQGSNMGQGVQSFNVNGLRNDQNSIRLDNANMIDPGNNGGMIIEPNMDMIQEFSVKLSSFEADQGRAAMIIEGVTKSGGKDFHGEGYFYARQAVLNANDWSNNILGVKKPGSKFNYPGFNVGGPVLIPGTDFNKNHDKMFFFGAIEWQRQLPDFGSQGAVVPSAAMRQGDFSELLRDAQPGGICAGKSRCLNMPVQLEDPTTWGTPIASNILPAGEINANSALLLSQYPLPNYVDPTGKYNFIGEPLIALNRSEENFKVDYNLNDSTRMYVRLARNADKQYYPWGLWSGINSGWTSNVPEPSPTVGNDLGESIGLELVKVINPTLTNEFQFNVSQLTLPNHFKNPNAVGISKAATGFKFSGMNFKNSQVPAFANGMTYGGDEMPQITDQWNFYNGGNPGTGRWGEGDVGSGIFADKTIFEGIDNVTKVHGAHTLKFGGNFERTRNDQNGGPVTEGLLITAENWGGMTTGNSFGDILANNFASFDQGIPNNDGLWRFWNVEGYAQDSWKVSRRLTVNYGLRLSWMQPWNEVRGLSTTFLPSAYVPANNTSFIDGIVTGKSGGVTHSVFPNPKFIPQPRLGFAWDMFGTGRTVLRGGLGTYISRDQGNTSFYMANADPFSFTAAVSAPGPFLTLQQIESANPFSSVGNIAVQAEDPKDPNQPQTYEWNFGIAQNIGLKTVVDAAYVANVSRHLYRQVNINAIPIGGMWIPGTTDCCANGDTNRSDYGPYKPFGTIDWSTHSDTANYNSLQVTLRRNVSHGLTLLGSYTWSKTMGYTSSFQGVIDPFSSQHSKTLLPWDHASILNLSYIYQLPNMGARHFAGNKIATGVLDGWQYSGITHITSGAPVFIGSPTINCMTAPNPATGKTDKNLCANGAFDNGNSRFSGSPTGWYGTADYGGGNNGVVHPVINWVGGGFNNVGDHWFSPSSVTLPGIGQNGTYETPTFRGPGSWSTDMTMFKNFKLGESRRLEFRFATFDTFNHANLGTGGADFGTTPIFNWVLPYNATHFSQGTVGLPSAGIPGIANADQFGVISNKHGHREVEMALKLYF
ncbi:MAG TPA: carboxypeptidase regulatory-like domain-containing protein [Terriglobia bacterium]|nr:carboxypeptidase regulatory-like domain-containing protein [Terriglobia bacterium]